LNLDDYIDLASERLGGAAILANDEFFAPKEALVKPSAPVWKEGEYTERGKWMDGWETRRRRTPGFDWCIVRLGLPGSLRAIVVDTAFFRGNYPAHCSIDGCALEGHEDLQARTPTDDEAGAVQRALQDPGSRGARELRESLLLQLRELEREGTLEYKMVANHFEQLIGHRWNEIAKELSITPKAMQTAADEIAKLDPRPGLKYAAPSPIEQADWFQLLPRSPLEGDSINHFEVRDARRVTHLRLNIFPDGGVARLRAHGIVLPDWNRLRKRGEVDLAAVENGGVVVDCSDMFFGHRHNLIMPGTATHMGDGWETRRRRGPGHDWSIIKLGTRGSIQRATVDTTHFKGNAPDSCMLEVCDTTDASPNEDVNWTTVLPRTMLQPHTRHSFDLSAPTATHARFSIFPDGGVGRLRLYGSIEPAE
jgi:allantoicase